MSFDDVWDSTGEELIYWLDVKIEDLKLTKQWEATRDYNHAILVGNAVNMTKKDKLPKIEQVYPSLFQKTEEEIAEEKKTNFLNQVMRIKSIEDTQ